MMRALFLILAVTVVAERERVYIIACKESEYKVAEHVNSTG